MASEIKSVPYRRFSWYFTFLNIHFTVLSFISVIGIPFSGFETLKYTLNMIPKRFFIWDLWCFA